VVRRIQIVQDSVASDLRRGEFLKSVQIFQSYFNKKAVLCKGNRAMPQPFFSVYSSPTTFTTSLRVAKL